MEILDAEHQLDLKEIEGKGESEEEFLFDDDLLKELPFFQDQPAKAEPGESTAKAQPEPTPEEPAPGSSRIPARSLKNAAAHGWNRSTRA